jgi:ABC-2 type transport system ATP-binding protein
VTLEVREVRKSFGEQKAVDGISFGASAGRIFGLLGPNGAGKTTIIRVIMNIFAPDQGSVLFDGRPLTARDKDRIGYLPEERGLYRKMYVGELLQYLASLKSRPRSFCLPRIDAWLERFGLGAWKKRKVEELSKGMAQKVQFVAAVLHEPELVFLDEPFAGLDPVATEVLREAVLELERQGRTVLLSTHIMEQAERMCRDLLLIDRGREVLAGSLESIKAGFGRHSVVVEFDGDAEVIRGSKAVAELITYPRWVEAELTAGAGADDLLRDLVGRVSVKRFELVAPSLHKIFLSRVGRDSVQEAACV